VREKAGGNVAKELIVDVISRTENELVIRTATGEEKKFTKEPGWADFDVHDLAITKGTSWISFGKTNHELPEIRTRIKGTAGLGKGSFSVVGEPTNTAKDFSLIIGAVNATEPQPNGITGWVGFRRHDWEIGNDNDWWVQCDLPKDAFDSLVLAIADRAVSKLSIGLQFRNGYTDFAYAPPSEGTDWFLIPDERDNSIDSPPTVLGEVTSFYLECQPISLCQKNPLAIEELQSETSDLIQPNVESAYGAQLKQLEIAIVQLRSSLKWIGWFVVIALVLIALK
jgi:hypothetical protein